MRCALSQYSVCTTPCCRPRTASLAVLRAGECVWSGCNQTVRSPRKVGLQQPSKAAPPMPAWLPEASSSSSASPLAACTSMTLKFIVSERLACLNPSVIMRCKFGCSAHLTVLIRQEAVGSPEPEGPQASCMGHEDPDELMIEYTPFIYIPC